MSGQVVNAWYIAEGGPIVKPHIPFSFHLVAALLRRPATGWGLAHDNGCASMRHRGQVTSNTSFAKTMLRPLKFGVDAEAAWFSDWLGIVGA